MTGAVHERLQLHTLADIEGAHAFWRVEFMPGNREYIHTQVIHPCCHFAHGLRGVGMEENAILAGDATDLGDGLNRTHLIVGVHDADEKGLRHDRPSYFLRVHQSRAVAAHAGHHGAQAFQKAAGRQDSGMLDVCGDDVPTAASRREEGTLQRGVIRFRAPAGEDDLVRRTAQQVRHLVACALDGHPRGQTCPVLTGGIPVMLGEIRQHGDTHF
ncbi:MAG: hypothetical protein BWY76_03352 [bacterium ADurb.Bin429]|nr:MAG: hypothetical protein BWY76_03352 [bacterium ADurb.Bin429]